MPTLLELKDDDTDLARSYRRLLQSEVALVAAIKECDEARAAFVVISMKIVGGERLIRSKEKTP